MTHVLEKLPALESSSRRRSTLEQMVGAITRQARTAHTHGSQQAATSPASTAARPIGRDGWLKGQERSYVLLPSLRLFRLRSLDQPLAAL